MGNYEQLKQSVSDVIKTNGNQEITGSILQNVLLTIISTVGENATFAGIATPTTNPGTPDGSVFYLASEGGTYTNFNAIELQDGLSVLSWNGSWSSQQIFSIDNVPTAGSDNLVKSGGVQGELALGAVYDVSAKNPTAGSNNDGKWESLSALLSDANLNTLIPIAVRKGGMSIKYVQSSDNKYVQWRLMAQNFTTNVTQWQGVDDEPIAGSDNLVKSGGVSKNSIVFSNTNGLADYPIFDGHISVNQKNIQSYLNGKHTVVKVDGGEHISIKKGANDYGKIAFVSDFDFWHGLPYSLLLVDNEASNVFTIDNDLEKTIPAGTKYMVIEVEFDGDDALPENIIINNGIDIINSIKKSTNDYIEKNEENIKKIGEAILNTYNISSILEKSTLQEARFTRFSTKINSAESGYIVKYAKVLAGNYYLLKANLVNSIPKNFWSAFSETEPAADVAITDVEGGIGITEYSRLFFAKKDGYILYSIYSGNFSGDEICQLNKRIGEDEESINKALYQDGEQIAATGNLSDAFFDEFSNFTIQSNSGFAIAYYQVYKGKCYHITCSNPVDAKIYTAFSKTIPSVGSTFTSLDGSKRNSYSREFVPSSNGYLLIARYSTNFQNLLVKRAESLKTTLNELTNNSSLVPDYWKTYISDKIWGINYQAGLCGANGDSFVFITDLHYPQNNYQSYKLIREVLNKTSVRKIFLGGDFNIVSESASTTDALEYIRKCRSDFSFTNNVFATRGNHDIKNSITDGQFYSVFNSEIDDKIDTKKKNYFYIDNVTQKIRYMILDVPQASYTTEPAEISAEQATWIENTITELESGWSIIVFFHTYWIPSDTVEVEGIGASAISHINAALAQAQNGVTMIAAIVGHCHRDRAVQDSTYGYWIISSTCDGNMNNDRPAGTTSEQAFDVFIINTATKKIIIRRIGVGSNREYTYGL